MKLQHLKMTFDADKFQHAILGAKDEDLDAVFLEFTEGDQDKLTRALSRARVCFFSLDAIVARSEYKLCPGSTVPEGFEVVGSWQEGIAAAKTMGFSGDSVAHGEYCHNDPNIFRGQHPKGMFKGSNGRFHFNCGDPGCSDGDEILVKHAHAVAVGGDSGTSKTQLIELANRVQNKTDSDMDEALKAMEGAAVTKLIAVAERASTASLPPASAKPPYFTAEEKTDLKKKWCEAESLKEAIRGKDTVLLKGSWLIQLSEDEGIIPKRQDLPPGAAWEPEELIGKLAEADHIQEWEHKVPIVALSYCWVEPSHPDPKGEQFKSVAKVLDVCLNGLGWDNDASRRVCVDMAVFWDYGSLYQNDRSEEELASFMHGLKSVNLWYSHQMTTVWMLTRVPKGVKPYVERGWPCFERQVATMTKPFHFSLDLGLLPEDYGGRQYYDLKNTCNCKRPPPVHPSVFRESLASKSFTNGSDRGFVMDKYNHTFNEVMGSASTLVFAQLAWGPEEYASVAACLPWCGNLETLNLCHNNGGNEGMKIIAEALASTRIKNLWFHDNKLDARGVDMLVTAAEKMETAEVIQCNFHGLSPEEKKGFEKRWEGKRDGVFG